MDAMELNKIFAAILVAGIVASMSGFIAEKMVGGHGGDEIVSYGEVTTNTTPAGGGHTAKQAMPEPVLALIASADTARGKKLSRACASCHSFDKNGRNGTGPNLWNMIGQNKAGKNDFSYSKAMTNAGGKWSYAELNRFLWKPKKYIKGTKMNFVGLKKPADRAAMIAWLRTLSDSNPALPSPGDIAAEESELSSE